MLNNITFILILLLIFTILLYYNSLFQENFIGNSDGIPVANHQQYVISSQKKFNELSNLINLTEPSVNISLDTQNAINNALQSVSVNPSIGAFNITGLENNTNIPDNTSSNFALASICESKPIDCSAFDDPTFSANCGISFDTKGTSYNGKPHIGGKFISSFDRSQQLSNMDQLDKSGQNGYIALKPTLGTSKPGTFAITKDQCIVLKEQIECQQKQTFNSPHCTQCITSGSFNRVDPNTPRLPSTLKLFGNGQINYSLEGVHSGNGSLSPNTSFDITIPANSEGTVLNINVEPNSNDTSNTPIYIIGYIIGQTSRGNFKLDFINLINIDKITSTKPKIGGTNIVDGFRAFVLMPGIGKSNMSLNGIIPFSFLSLYNSDVRNCDNGPIITQTASAIFLESNPCFNSNNKPGNYSLECLQNRWIQLGGSPKGLGYPNTKEKADLLQIDSNGNPIDIDSIMNNLYPKFIQASTGLNSDGTPMTIPQWNTISMWVLGIPINTPCDSINNDSTQISQQCLEYLYLNKGGQSHIGSTYTLPLSDSNLKDTTDDNNVYCYPGAPLDPATNTGKEFIQKYTTKGINSVKTVYDTIHRIANDNTRSNDNRKEALNLCYGVNIDLM
jgi:hypothetical protein